MSLNMHKYILAHWRGEQSLLRSCLVNGVAVGFGVVVLVGLAGVGLWYAVAHYCAVSDARFCTAGWSRFYFMAYIKDPFTTLTPLIWAVWACVGIFRCGRRVGFKEQNTRARKIGGVTATAGAVLFAVWIGGAVGYFIYGEYLFAVAKPCFVDRYSSECDASEARVARLTGVRPR
jgi:hypothetical protein